MISVDENLNRDSDVKSSCQLQNKNASILNQNLRSFKSQSDFSKYNNFLVQRMESSLQSRQIEDPSTIQFPHHLEIQQNKKIEEMEQIKTMIRSLQYNIRKGTKLNVDQQTIHLLKKIDDFYNGYEKSQDFDDNDIHQKIQNLNEFKKKNQWLKEFDKKLKAKFEYFYVPYVKNTVQAQKMIKGVQKRRQEYANEQQIYKQTDPQNQNNYDFSQAFCNNQFLMPQQNLVNIKTKNKNKLSLSLHSPIHNSHKTPKVNQTKFKNIDQIITFEYERKLKKRVGFSQNKIINKNIYQRPGSSKSKYSKTEENHSMASRQESQQKKQNNQSHHSSNQDSDTSSFSYTKIQFYDKQDQSLDFQNQYKYESENYRLWKKMAYLIIGPEHQYKNLKVIIQKLQKLKELAQKYKSDRSKKLKRYSQHYSENINLQNNNLNFSQNKNENQLSGIKIKQKNAFRQLSKQINKKLYSLKIEEKQEPQKEIICKTQRNENKFELQIINEKSDKIQKSTIQSDNENNLLKNQNTVNTDINYQIHEKSLYCVDSENTVTIFDSFSQNLTESNSKFPKQNKQSFKKFLQSTFDRNKQVNSQSDQQFKKYDQTESRFKSLQQNYSLLSIKKLEERKGINRQLSGYQLGSAKMANQYKNILDKNALPLRNIASANAQKPKSIQNLKIITKPAYLFQEDQFKISQRNYNHKKIPIKNQETQNENKQFNTLKFIQLFEKNNQFQIASKNEKCQDQQKSQNIKMRFLTKIRRLREFQKIKVQSSQPQQKQSQDNQILQDEQIKETTLIYEDKEQKNKPSTKKYKGVTQLKSLQELIQFTNEQKSNHFNQTQQYSRQYDLL